MSTLGKVVSINTNDFYRFFRKKVRDSVLNDIFGGDKDVMAWVNDVLPEILLTVIPKLEKNLKASGWMKFNSLNEIIYNELVKYKLSFLQPFITELLQYAVISIYQKHFMDKMKSLGLHDKFEKAVGLDFDESGEIGDSDIKETKSTSETEEESEEFYEPFEPSESDEE